MSGWIKLHRSIMEKGWFHKADYLQLWVYLLMKASHTEYEYFWNGKNVKLKPGQFITGRKKIASEIKMNESKVERILKAFEIEQQIEQRKTNTSRCISIVNYKKYQVSEQQNEQRVNNERTTSEQRVNTKQERKNLKNVKNERKDSAFENFWNLYKKKIDKKKCQIAWNNLTKKDQEAIVIHIPSYIKFQPEAQFRKDPTSYIYNRSWENEYLSKDDEEKIRLEKLKQKYRDERLANQESS